MIWGLLLACKGPQPLALDATTVAVVASQPVVLSGQSLGDAGTARLNGVEIPVAWSPTSIALTLPDDARSGTIVLEGETREGEVQLEVWDYRWIDLPPTPGTNALPLSITHDDAGRVFVNQEFHRAFHILEGDTVVQEPIPVPETPIFAFRFETDDGVFENNTHTSVLGEDVELAPDGSVWFSQGGGLHYEGDLENHSRVVRYDPDTTGDPFRVYNIPGDHNEVTGIAFDPSGEIWLSESTLEGAAFLHFDPETLPFDNTFDFSTSLADQICVGPVVAGCIERIPLDPPTLYPAHLFLDDSGRLWFTAFWGQSIGVYDPASGETRLFPLQPPSTQTGTFVGSGPWEITEGANGERVFGEYFDVAAGWFDTARWEDPACLALVDGVNPCIEEIVLGEGEDLRLHSLDGDGTGRVWFTLEHTLGFFTPEREPVIFPTFEDFPGDDVQSFAGITARPGEVWVAEFLRKRVGHLRRRD